MAEAKRNIFIGGKFTLTNDSVSQYDRMKNAFECRSPSGYYGGWYGGGGIPADYHGTAGQYYAAKASGVACH